MSQNRNTVYAGRSPPMLEEVKGRSILGVEGQRSQFNSPTRAFEASPTRGPFVLKPTLGEKDDDVDSYNSKEEDLYLPQMTNFVSFDKRMRKEEYKLPAYILQDRVVHEEYWKNVPMAVVQSV